jgi:hypothetical protein
VRSLALLALALLPLSGCLGGGDDGERAASAPTTPPPTTPPPAAPADVHASADLGAPPASPPSMSGFLHALTAESPPDRLVRPLRPRLWRSSPGRAPLERVASLGARYQLVLSDGWGNPKDGWGAHGPPWRDLEVWRRFAVRTARGARPAPAEWDVWNEPDNPAFWNGTREQFFRVYETAERALRKELGPDAVVGGPSTTKPLPAWLGGLLEYCRRRGCRVDFLSFHANLQPYERIEALSGTVRRLRRRYGKRIEVNEAVGPADQYRPGEILGFLHHLEAGGADAAARSCWPDLAGGDNCSNGTLEGLLTPAGEPRSAWWAYRAYADGVGARVPGGSDDPAVAVLASARTAGGGGPQVLLARLDRVEAGAGPVQVDLTLRGLAGAPGLRGARRAVASVALLPDSGEAPLSEPRPVARHELAIGAGEVTLRAGALAPHEAMLVTLRPD